ncbi:hypothetical protein B0H63DRAFT_550694 [Podospora didyma]|uniref:Uncharacterized protein n=1 Tax=Podospora didyma TaxID=330526 RepID=A0AAE0K9U7_9PEZI|nr:hypothetical protein B0H63DRAFT_550694 [Podospora didyma]
MEDTSTPSRVLRARTQRSYFDPPAPPVRPRRSTARRPAGPKKTAKKSKKGTKAKAKNKPALPDPEDDPAEEEALSEAEALGAEASGDDATPAAEAEEDAETKDDEADGVKASEAEAEASEEDEQRQLELLRRLSSPQDAQQESPTSRQEQQSTNREDQPKSRRRAQRQKKSSSRTSLPDVQGPEEDLEEKVEAEADVSEVEAEASEADASEAAEAEASKAVNAEAEDLEAADVADNESAEDFNVESTAPEAAEELTSPSRSQNASTGLESPQNLDDRMDIDEPDQAERADREGIQRLAGHMSMGGADENEEPASDDMAADQMAQRPLAEEEEQPTSEQQADSEDKEKFSEIHLLESSSITLAAAEALTKARGAMAALRLISGPKKLVQSLAKALNPGGTLVVISHGCELHFYGDHFYEDAPRQTAWHNLWNFLCERLWGRMTRSFAGQDGCRPDAQWEWVKDKAELEEFQEEMFEGWRNLKLPMEWFCNVRRSQTFRHARNMGSLAVLYPESKVWADASRYADRERGRLARIHADSIKKNNKDSDDDTNGDSDKESDKESDKNKDKDKDDNKNSNIDSDSESDRDIELREIQRKRKVGKKTALRIRRESPHTSDENDIEDGDPDYEDEFDFFGKLNDRMPVNGGVRSAQENAGVDGHDDAGDDSDASEDNAEQDVTMADDETTPMSAGMMLLIQTLPGMMLLIQTLPGMKMETSRWPTANKTPRESIHDPRARTQSISSLESLETCFRNLKLLGGAAPELECVPYVVCQRRYVRVGPEVEGINTMLSMDVMQ